MKKVLLFLLVSICSFAQAVRVDPIPAFTTLGNSTPGTPTPVLTLPFAYVAICNAPPNATTCTNFATTYVAANASTACPISQQVVLAGSAVCGNQADAQGNFGFWLLPGQYAYTVTWAGKTYGPYPITAGSSNYPVNYSSSFNFSPQVQSASATAGVSTTATLTPCVASGTDTKHYLYVSGGTGAAEAVLITGGSCQLGANAGTIMFTTANSHSGAWTISSATSGITEAEYALPSTGGKVYIPHGSYQLLAAIPYSPNVTFDGDGVGTVLLPASCSATIFDANLPVHSNSEYTVVADNVSFRNFLIEGAQCSEVNSITGIREINQAGSTEVWSMFGATVDNVYFDNVRYGVLVTRVNYFKLLNVWAYENTTFNFYDSTESVSYNNANITVDKLMYTWHPINSNSQQVTNTSAIITCELCEVFYMQNSVISNRPIANVSAVNMISGEDAHFLNNNFETCFFGIQLSSVTTVESVLLYTGYTKVIGNNFDGIWGGALNVQNGVSSAVNSQAHDIQVSDNFFTNANNTLATPILLRTGQYTQSFSVTNNMFGGLSANNETAFSIDANADNVSLDSTNIWDNRYANTITGTVYGITAAASATNVRGLQNQVFQNFTIGLNDLADVITVAAGTTSLTLPTGRTQVSINGTGNPTIGSIAAQPIGTVVTLLVYTALTIQNSGNLKLGANFVATAVNPDTITLYCDGTSWYKISGSVN